jgi:hypothetical protein
MMGEAGESELGLGLAGKRRSRRGERAEPTSGLGESDGLEWNTSRERRSEGSCGERWGGSGMTMRSFHAGLQPPASSGRVAVRREGSR